MGGQAAETETDAFDIFWPNWHTQFPEGKACSDLVDLDPDSDHWRSKERDNICDGKVRKDQSCWTRSIWVRTEVLFTVLQLLRDPSPRIATHATSVVISLTISWVSQKKLSSEAGISLFIEIFHTILWWFWQFRSGSSTKSLLQWNYPPMHPGLSKPQPIRLVPVVLPVLVTPPPPLSSHFNVLTIYHHKYLWTEKSQIQLISIK